ncbi:hypothetical protein L2E82_30723 [Cichorium intybus]|uniref:Uncharacterized protein n=1 Tax=Cichorium intybus TaxID=13427 RepID=A0ACB9D181_CICIN|nr:hypothetical protein L2E82_30723 [Cichorium intybus]
MVPQAAEGKGVGESRRWRLGKERDGGSHEEADRRWYLDSTSVRTMRRWGWRWRGQYNQANMCRYEKNRVTHTGGESRYAKE